MVDLSIRSLRSKLSVNNIISHLEPKETAEVLRTANLSPSTVRKTKNRDHHRRLSPSQASPLSIIAGQLQIVPFNSLIQLKLRQVSSFLHSEGLRGSLRIRYRDSARNAFLRLFRVHNHFLEVDCLRIRHAAAVSPSLPHTPCGLVTYSGLENHSR